MPTVAEQLHTAREAQKLTIHQVAETTKIRTDHLRALEEGNFDVFPAPVYIRGFVRSYASLLKMDVPTVMAALEAELGRTEKFREPPALSRQPRGAVDFLMLQLSRLNWQKGLVVVGGVVLVVAVVLGVVAWRRHNSSLSGLAPGVYQPAESSGNTLPLPPVSTPRRP